MQSQEGFEISDFRSSFDNDSDRTDSTSAKAGSGKRNKKNSEGFTICWLCFTICWLYCEEIHIL